MIETACIRTTLSDEFSDVSPVLRKTKVASQDAQPKGKGKGGKGKAPPPKAGPGCRENCPCNEKNNAMCESNIFGNRCAHFHSRFPESGKIWIF